MNDSLYQRIEPYLVLSSEATPTGKYNKPTIVSPQKRTGSGIEPDEKSVAPATAKTPVAMPRVELNHATVEELEALPGIGPTLSQRIVKYRDLLGGFSSVDQLGEVYGLKPEVIDLNRNRLVVDTIQIRKLDLNFLTVEELAKHPYLNFREARKIVDFRSKNGYISNKYQLLNDSVIAEKLFRKLVVYLK